MKNIKYLFGILIVVILSTGANSHSANNPKYDIAQFYEAVVPSDGTKAMNTYGNIEDVQAILSPTSLKAGNYEVTLTKKAANFYKIDDTNICIETRYCYEYAQRREAILIIETSYGYISGEVIFTD